MCFVLIYIKLLKFKLKNYKLLISIIFLQELFSQLQYSHESALPPDALRRALAQTFYNQQRFQLGFMDDAAECFENILLRIHFHIASGEAEDMCNARYGFLVFILYKNKRLINIYSLFNLTTIWYFWCKYDYKWREIILLY